MLACCQYSRTDTGAEVGSRYSRGLAERFGLGLHSCHDSNTAVVHYPPMGGITMSAVPKTLLSPQEYLARERQAEFKSEYYRGETFAMAGASYVITALKDNLVRRSKWPARRRPVSDLFQRPAGQGRCHRAIHLPGHRCRLRTAGIGGLRRRHVCSTRK